MLHYSVFPDENAPDMRPTRVSAVPVRLRAPDSPGVRFKDCAGIRGC